MSTVRLLKDDPRGKRGDVVSAPFGIARDMVAAGLAEYPPVPAGPPRAASAPAAPDRHAAEIVRLNDQHLRAVAEVRAAADAAAEAAKKAHAGELAALRAELEAANKAVTDLQAKLKK